MELPVAQRLRATDLPAVVGVSRPLHGGRGRGGGGPRRGAGGVEIGSTFHAGGAQTRPGWSVSIRHAGDPASVWSGAPRGGWRRRAGAIGGGGLDGLAGRERGRRISIRRHRGDRGPTVGRRGRQPARRAGVGVAPRRRTGVATGSRARVPGGCCGAAGGRADRCSSGRWR